MKIQKGFTLVELIVVITILAVLSTIGFVSYSGYLAGTRDTSRIASLKAISEGLELYSTRHNLPNPDEATTQILDNGTQIATQGYVGKNVLETITYSTEGTDPKDGTYYSYYLTRDKKYFQLMAFLEEEENLNSTANAVDYSTRYPTVFGKKLGILVDSNNTPIQELTGSIDISDVGDLELKAYLKDYDYISGTGTTFQPLATFAKVGGKFCALTNLKCIDPNKLIIPTDGLIFYFPLGNNANGEIGNYNGIINGDVSFDGISSNFDGDEDYIDLNSLNLTNIRTLSIWFKTEQESGYPAFISQGYDGGTDFNLLQIEDSTHVLRFATTNGNDPVGTKEVNDGEWHNVIIYKDDNNKFKGFLDGLIEIDSDDNVWFGTDTDTNTNTIGACKRDSIVSDLDGFLTKFRGYDRLLTNEEIGIIYTKEKEEF